MVDEDVIFSELTEGDIPELVDKVAGTARETGAHNQDIQDLTLWKWQYQDLPTGKSHVYIARYAGAIVGYYHIATYDFLARDKKLRIGQIQSVSVSPTLRGQGMFRRLADFAHTASMAHVDLIYTFPNVRSIHTFLKYNGYKIVKPLPVFLLPLDTAEIIRARCRLFALEKILGGAIDLWGKALRKPLSLGETLSIRSGIDDEVLGVFQKFQNLHTLRLSRSREYLNWRYLETPKGQHFIVGLEREGALKSVAVLKYEVLFSTRGLLVMDFAHDRNPADLNRLLCNLPDLIGSGLPHRAAFIMVSGLARGVRELKKTGFISMPQRLIPRQLNLLARWMRGSCDLDIHDPEKWLVTLGDWDVF